VRASSHISPFQKLRKERQFNLNFPLLSVIFEFLKGNILAFIGDSFGKKSVTVQYTEQYRYHNQTNSKTTNKNPTMGRDWKRLALFREQTLEMIWGSRTRSENSASGNLKNDRTYDKDTSTGRTSTVDDGGHSRTMTDEFINSAHIDSFYILNDHYSMDIDSLLSEGTTSTGIITDTSMAITIADANRDEIQSASSPALQGEKFDLDNTMEDSSHSDTDDSDDDSFIWQSVAIDFGASISSHTTHTTHTSRASGSTALVNNTSGRNLKSQGSEDSSSSLSIVKSPMSSSVRFKDVKPSIADNLAQARALIDSARMIQSSFSSD